MQLQSCYDLRCFDSNGCKIVRFPFFCHKSKVSDKTGHVDKVDCASFSRGTFNLSQCATVIFIVFLFPFCSPPSFPKFSCFIYLFILADLDKQLLLSSCCQMNYFASWASSDCKKSVGFVIVWSGLLVVLVHAADNATDPARASGDDLNSKVQSNWRYIVIGVASALFLVTGKMPAYGGPKHACTKLVTLSSYALRAGP